MNEDIFCSRILIRKIFRESPLDSSAEAKPEVRGGFHAKFVVGGGEDNPAFASPDVMTNDAMSSSEFVVRKRSVLRTSESAGNIESRVGCAVLVTLSQK
jgi:hypothetical protein